jgi:hypothetical protein
MRVTTNGMAIDREKAPNLSPPGDECGAAKLADRCAEGFPDAT